MTPDPTTPRDAPTSSAAMRAARLESAVGALLGRGAMSRTELSRVTGYSPSSMTATIRELMAEGYVSEVGQLKSTGGRRQTLLQFDRGAVVLTLVTIGTTHLHVSQIGMDGTVHVHIRRGLDHDDPTASLVQAIETLHQVAERPSVCVVVSMPGVVSAEGVVTLAPAFGAPLPVSLADELRAATGLPVIIDNDVNLLALGETIAGAARDVQDVALIYVGDGIGAALVLGGAVHRGASQSAGEIGFLPWERVRPLADRAVGPLEARWSAAALTGQAEEIGIEPGDRSVLAALGASPDPRARELVDGAVEAWSYAAVVTACLLDPAAVVFAGEAVHLPDWARADLERRVVEAVPAPVQVRFAELGEEAIAHGAIARLEAQPRLVLDLRERPEPEEPERSAAADPEAAPVG